MAWRWLQALLAEPLVHFAALGALLFAALPADPPPSRELDGPVVVSDALVSAFKAERRAALRREPTDREMAEVLDGYVTDELLVREARALGLDRTDPVVRRRLIELTRSIGQAVAEPTGQDLQATLDQHRARFRRPGRVTLDHVFIATSETAAERAQQLLAALRAGASTAGQGDPHGLGRSIAGRTQDTLSRSFTHEIATAAFELPLGVWSAPLAAADGLHLVRVKERSDGAAPPLALVRDEVREVWLQGRRRVALEDYLAGLRRRDAGEGP